MASVSGGSITNGYLAQTLDYSTFDAKSFTKNFSAPLASRIAQRGTLFAPLTTKVYICLVLLSGLVTLVVPWFLPIRVAWQGRLFVVGVLWCAWLVAQRGRICGLAYRRTLFSPGGTASMLADVWRPVNHDVLRDRPAYWRGLRQYGRPVGQRWPGLTDLDRAPRDLIVVNSTGRSDWKPLRHRIPVWAPGLTAGKCVNGPSRANTSIMVALASLDSSRRQIRVEKLLEVESAA